MRYDGCQPSPYRDGWCVQFGRRRAPRKLYLRALNNQRNLRFDHVVALAKAFGFELDRSDGSHHIFRHPGVRGRVNLQPDNGMAKAYQVRQLLDLIASLGPTLEDDE